MLKLKKFEEVKNTTGKRTSMYAFEDIFSLTKKFAGFQDFSPKQAGISLLVAMIGSSIALGVVTGIMISLSHSLEQAQNIERSTQVFFAVESGLEAGFFHHNARGQGTEFHPLDYATFEVDAASQIIEHNNVNLDTKWTIKGRADSDSFTGLMKEFQSVQLRWFWDTSDSVDDPVSIVHHEPEFNINLTPDPSFDFNLPIGEDGPIIDWMITRKSSIDGVTSLGPYASDPEDPCAPGGSYFCKNSSPFNLSYTLNGTLSPRIGTITEMQILSFINDVNSDSYQIVLSPLTSFTSENNGDTIAGIPYDITEGNGEFLPLPSYTIDTQVEALGFVKNLSLENIPEASAISAFNYVVFD